MNSEDLIAAFLTRAEDHQRTIDALKSMVEILAMEVEALRRTVGHGDDAGNPLRAEYREAYRETALLNYDASGVFPMKVLRRFLLDRHTELAREGRLPELRESRMLIELGLGDAEVREFERRAKEAMTRT